MDDHFLEDLRGYVWLSQRKSHRTWRALAADAKLSPQTVARFASGRTKKPQHNTIQALLGALSLRFGIFRSQSALQKEELNIRGFRKHIP